MPSDDSNANGGERLRRDDPERTEPRRHWSNLYRDDGSWNERDAAAPGDPEGGAARGESWRDAVAEGVGLGYRVIEEQIRQGQRVAEQMSEAAYGPSAVPGDMREAAERMMRYAADLAALWFDFVNSTLGNGEVLRGLAASWQTSQAGPAAPAAPASDGPAPTAYDVEVRSARQVRLSLELKPGARGRALATHGLRAVESEKPPIADVRFEPATDGPPVLCVRVADAQPPGLYTGVVVDQQSGDLLGTLTARVTE